MSLEKFITKEEKLVKFNNRSTGAPHSVLQVIAIGKSDGKNRMVTTQCTISGDKVILNIPPFVEVEKDEFLLIQRKAIGTPSELVKLKDIADSDKWETGNFYYPSLKDSLPIKLILLEEKVTLSQVSMN